MPYHYQAYNIPIISAIELPALLNSTEQTGGAPIEVEIGEAPKQLHEKVNEIKPFSTFNEREFLYTMPHVANYYVANGNRIIIEPISANWNEILLYFYSNCLAAALYQRHRLPFHVSGVLVANKIVLFAAPSRTGKSTTATKLQELGYEPFTDDTAILEVENGICYATASYPMARLWQNTIEAQTLYDDAQKQLLNAEINKYGFAFHEQFVAERMPVAAIIFLEVEGSEIHIKPLLASKCMQLLGQNLYRGQWVKGMKKQHLQFEKLSSVAHVLPAFLATRPKGKNTFETFAKAIENQIIQHL